MSHTSVYALYKTKVTCLEQLKNSHGSGPAIWDYISVKLRGRNFDMFNDDGFWPLWKDMRLSDNERAVLLSTYDCSYVEIDHLQQFSEACSELHNLIVETTRWTWNHFGDIARIASELADHHDYRCKGLAIGCTSVCDIWEARDISGIDAWGIYANIDRQLKPEIVGRA